MQSPTWLARRRHYDTAVQPSVSRDPIQWALGCNSGR